MKKLLITLGLLTFCVAGVFAQTKFGYISASELISLMPETKKADAEVKAYAKTFEDQLMKMQTELQTKLTSYQKDEPTLNEAMREVRQRELQDLDNRINELNQSAQEKIAAKKEALLSPILDKAEKAIKAVAAQNGYAYIFDSSTGALLVMPDGDDILPLVKKYLNITDAPATPSTPKPASTGTPKAPAPAAPKR